MFKEFVAKFFKGIINKLVISAKNMIIDDLASILKRELSDEKIQKFTAEEVVQARDKIIARLLSLKD